MSAPWIRPIDPTPIDCTEINEALRYPARYEARRAAAQAEIDALFSEHNARVRAEQEARWAAEEAAL
ncbi:MAG: hypothetical protein PGN16_04350 [Sphingomonas phyllosphaerae]|uniref:hypothetical protein n=1 Tax=Sphingomonas phyllosphaerae TaxID=257003 RepID=UPI002FFC49DD